MRQLVLLVCVLATACGDDSSADSGVDAGAEPDVGRDSAEDARGDTATAMDAQGSDAGPVELGEPLVVPMGGDAFTLFRSDAFPGAQCQDGSEAGISVRLNPGATGAVIFLQGGGLCIDPVTCAGVRNRNGFTQSAANEQIIAEAAALMNAGDEANPVQNFHHVFVHYCSGDFHAGAEEDGFEGAVHRGRANMEAFISRLVPTLSDVEVVLLAGSSAGALGTLLSYPLVQRAFGDTPVHAFIDSPPVSADEVFRPCQQSLWAESLGVDSTLDLGCEDCDLRLGGYEAYLERLVDAYPERRFGWFSGTEDAVLACLATLAGGECTSNPVPGAAFSSALVAMRERLADRPNFKTFFYPSNRHTALFFPTVSFTNLDAVGGVSLGPWLENLISGEGEWDHVRGETLPAEQEITDPCD